MSVLSRALALSLGLLVQPLAAADFNVSNVGATTYRINGVNNPNLTLERGRTYTFAVAASGHPFWVKSSRVTGTGSAYSTGVTGNGVSSGTLTFAVPTNAPDTLYYICQFHSAMSGRLDVVNPPPPVPARLTNPARLPGGSVQFTVLGTGGRPHLVQAVTNVNSTNWTTLLSTNPAAGSFLFMDTNGALPRRFYRVTQ